MMTRDRWTPRHMRSSYVPTTYLAPSHVPCQNEREARIADPRWIIESHLGWFPHKQLMDEEQDESRPTE